MILRAGDVDAAVARTVLLQSFPGSLEQEPRRAAWTLDFVDQRIRGSSTVVRLGVRVTAVVLGLVVRVVHRADVRNGAPEAVAAPLQRWMDLPLPVLAEYVRLVRSLTLVGWFDAPGAVR
jgi:hypothetical protein